MDDHEKTCPVCIEAAEFQAVTEKYPELRAWLNDIYCKLEVVETDAIYWKCKYEGIWPGDKDMKNDKPDNLRESSLPAELSSHTK